MKKFNEIEYIIQYEAGELKGEQILELFSHLLKTKKVWHLQGSYGRFADNLIKRGYLSITGDRLKEIISEA